MSKRMHWAWGTLAHRIGRRGAFLGFLFVLDMGTAWSLWPLEVPRRFTLILPPHVWACLWLVAAAFCGVGVFMRRDRVPYTAAAAIKTLWAMLYFHLWLVQQLTDAWISAIVWLIFALIILMVSSWPDSVLVADGNDSRRHRAASGDN